MVFSGFWAIGDLWLIKKRLVRSPLRSVGLFKSILRNKSQISSWIFSSTNDTREYTKYRAFCCSLSPIIHPKWTLNSITKFCQATWSYTKALLHSDVVLADPVLPPNYTAKSGYSALWISSNSKLIELQKHFMPSPLLLVYRLHMITAFWRQCCSQAESEVCWVKYKCARITILKE